ncbi:hypothetical protein N7467_011020 [Penicillium canescens]|nr:hypothetical protein N7467_011020 [Penicillium canescens]
MPTRIWVEMSSMAVILGRWPQKTRDVLKAERHIVEVYHTLQFRPIPEARIEAISEYLLLCVRENLAHFTTSCNHHHVAPDVCSTPPLRPHARKPGTVGNRVRRLIAGI